MEILKAGKAGCNHTWRKVDADDKFRKEGNFEVIRKKSRCVKCGAEILRKVHRRF